MEIKRYLVPFLIGFLAVAHLVGLMGFSSPEWQETFRMLTPYHLAISYGIMISMHKHWDFSLITFIALSFLIGIAMEILGVYTGLVFGEYHYSENLGLKVGGTPLIIGVNWVMLTYMTGYLANKLTTQVWVRILIGAIAMVLLDVLIEPFAISQNLWQWEANSIPLRNYAAWFFISLILHGLFQFFLKGPRNPLTLPLLLIQTAFFGLGWALGIWGL